jgi:riboflavin synthase
VFSGIIETPGEISGHREGRLEIALREPFDGLGAGESVAVNGVCLTVAAVTSDGFAADVMPETLRRTTLGGLTSGATVNLERALQLGDRISGHLVTGHVDATGTVAAVREDANARWATITAPDDLLALVAEKGSIAVDGISLTVVDVFDAAFTVSLIPTTLAVTTAGGWAVGSQVNLEADLIARYFARSLAGTPDARAPAALGASLS